MPVVVPICPSGYHWDLTRQICLNDDGSNECGLGEILGDSGCESIYGTDGCPNPCIGDPDPEFNHPWWDANLGACNSACPIGQAWAVGTGPDDIGACQGIVCPDGWIVDYTGYCVNPLCPIGWIQDGVDCVQDPDNPVSPLPINQYDPFLWPAQYQCSGGVRRTCSRICADNNYHFIGSPCCQSLDVAAVTGTDCCFPNACPGGKVSTQTYLISAHNGTDSTPWCHPNPFSPSGDGIEITYQYPGETWRDDGHCNLTCVHLDCMDYDGNITGGTPDAFGACPDGSFPIESGYFVGEDSPYGTCENFLCAKPESPQYDDFGWNKSDCICGTPRQLDSSYDAHQIYKYVFKEEQYSNADFTEDHIRVILEKWQFFNGFGWVEILDGWPKIVQDRGFSPSIIKLADGPMGLCYLDINRKPVSSKWNVPFAQESDAMQVTDLKADYVSHTQDRFGRLIVCIFGRDDQKWFVCVGKPIKRVNPGDPVWQFSDPVDMNVTDSRSMKGSVECLSQGTLMLTYTDESRSTRFVVNQGLADDGTGDWIPG